MTVWVTGANGFIGRNLTRMLAEAGEVVHGLGHGAIQEEERERLGLTHWLNGEIESANLNALAHHAGLPSTIFHLAGGSSVGLSIEQPYEDFARTVCSTARLLEWMRVFAPNCRLVVASSAAVYGANHPGPIMEDAEASPMSPYGQHKLIMEQLCRSFAITFGVQCRVVRLFSVYGRDLRKQLLWDICSRLLRDERTLILGGTGAEVRDCVDVRDATRLLSIIARSPQQENYRVINGGSGIATTVADVARAVVKNWGKDVSVRFSGTSRSGDPFSLIAETTRLRELPFSSQILPEQGIADYVHWFKDQARR